MGEYVTRKEIVVPAGTIVDRHGSFYEIVIGFGGGHSAQLLFPPGLIKDNQYLFEKTADVHAQVRRSLRMAIQCPFHAEVGSSLVLDSVTGKYHCFGCGKDGTIEELKERFPRLKESIEELVG